MDRNMSNDGPKKLDASSAIETVYRNFTFRSRLEAKWAVFFDLCGWSWSYEPKDLNGWIPDFSIGEWPTLVEIKPFFNSDEWGDAKRKIIKSGCDEAVLLLGADPTWRANNESEDGGGGVAFADFFHRLYDGDWITETIHFGLTEGNNKPGLCPMDGGWSNRIWLAPNDASANKWSRVWLEGDAQREVELVAKWAKACNASRWMKYEGKR